MPKWEFKFCFVTLSMLVLAVLLPARTMHLHLQVLLHLRRWYLQRSSGPVPHPLNTGRPCEDTEQSAFIQMSVQSMPSGGLSGPFINYVHLK